jgi:parallel beta-helix repeat protein
MDDNHDLFVGLGFSAYNIRFHCRFSNCHFLVGSVVKLIQCSFTSSNDTHASFISYGKLKVDFCKFYNCKKGGLLVEGDAEITNSQFYDDAVPLEVRGGRLFLRKSKVYGNKQGLLIGSQAKECVVEDCALYDNGSCGIAVTNFASNVEICGSRIYDNDGPGIAVMNSKAVSIFENEIRGNCEWGICISPLSQAVVKKNKIQNNHCGGILVESHPLIPSVEKSVVECNHISFNSGPGIHEEGFPTQCRENKSHDNKEERNQLTAKSEAKFCYYCRKPGKNLQKCFNCFTAKYCGEECQKNDSKKHKDICDRLLADGSIVLNYVRKPIMTHHLPPNERDPAWNDSITTTERGPGLLPVGPTYCPPPNTTTMFIVKMSADSKLVREFNPSMVRLYDRSLKLDGILTDANQIYHLVWKHGAMGQLYKHCKKLFMWVKGPEHGKLRVFINEFPPYQNW